VAATAARRPPSSMEPAAARHPVDASALSYEERALALTFRVAAHS
jgi:hypothetical protein